MCTTSTCNCEPRLAPGFESVPRVRLVHPAHIPKFGLQPNFQPDLLAAVTAKHKHMLDYVKGLVSRISQNNTIKTLTRSNQPAHATALIALCFVFSYFFRSQTTTPKPYSTCTTVIYLLCFGLKMGAQFWMTFVSGLSLYFSLSRHAFGDVQRVLFPRYFTFTCILSALNLIAFSMLHSHIQWQYSHWFQMSLISTSFILELLARLYVAPDVIRLMDTKKEIELTEPGVGQEIASHKPGRLQYCPHYMMIHSSFRKKHSIMALANIISMLCTFTQLFYIAGSISILPV
ncbi:transmembrane protein 205 [Cimex lectularius]|uniref:TMEM205-like domain-containing protein n=1 Tax=Cimex lectularius TaxID=79782 RepID=A0A8I6RRC3_CIMLE|nr:transmembrane protein 205 [Cimex lectularius]